MTDRRRVLLVRYHDGAARTNWGGRATSLALAEIIERMPDRAVGDVVNGVWLTQDYDATLPPKAMKRLQRLEGVARADRLVSLAKNGKFEGGAPAFDAAPRERAAQLLSARGSAPALDAILAQIEASDELVVNGEGDFILTQRRSLWRCLVLMELGCLLGRPVHLVNAMLSRGPDGETDPAVVQAVRATLRAVETVALRDRESVRLCAELFPDIRATFCPDALFSWSEPVRRIVDAPGEGPLAEGVPPDLRRALRRPYVAVGGGSLGRSGRKEAADGRLARMLEALGGAGRSPVVVATCTGDDWMLRVADRAGAPALASNVPLAVGAHVLGRADAFLSGRYHPSILAALAGTPCVFMRSNSHKTRSLPELLDCAQTVDFPFFNDEQDLGAIVAATIAAAEGVGSERARLRGVVDRLAAQAQALPLSAAG